MTIADIAFAKTSAAVLALTNSPSKSVTAPCAASIPALTSSHFACCSSTLARASLSFFSISAFASCAFLSSVSASATALSAALYASEFLILAIASSFSAIFSSAAAL